MSGGAAAASAGPAPQLALFGYPPLSPSQTECALPGVIENARYAFFRALDHGTDGDLAQWARLWGESLITFAQGRVAGVEDDAHDVSEASNALEAALTALASAEAALKAIPFNQTKVAEHVVTSRARLATAIRAIGEL